MWTVDVDVGGTLTDAVFTEGDRVVCVKVDTTAHDLTLCLLDCLSKGAARIGFDDASTLIDDIEVIRWSTTITSNVLAEQSGPRIGLLVSGGHERDLYGSDGKSVVLDRIVAESDVIGLSGAVTETEVMNAARGLLERGVRRICVSLKAAHHNPETELSIKRTIDQHYPDHFLGSVPILAGSDIAKAPHDQTRTYCALINAYTHGALAATLFKAEDELRDTLKFSGTFLVSHVNGGASGVAKTRAIDTIESGPVLGINGSSYLARVYGLKNLIAMDIGGTTAKISILAEGRPVYRRPSDFFGIPVGISLPDLRSIALGGGSVVKPGPETPGSAKSPGDANAIQLGPESMGAYPGPACYGLGGDLPTLTDAFVTAGLINPDYFLGGTKPIDRELARRAIKELVARLLNISTEAACQATINRAFDLVADLIGQVEPGRDLSGHTLFAYGGNGGLFACGLAEKAGITQVQVFSLGPVFSAFGSSVSDVSHVYERSLPGLAISDSSVTRIRDEFRDIKAESVKDLLGEGIRPEGVAYALEFEVSMGGGDSIPVPCPESALAGANEMRAVLSGALKTGIEASEAQMRLELIRVRASKAMPKPKLVECQAGQPDPSGALTGTREVLWGSRDGKARVYRWESLQPGSRVDGCALLEGENTTYFVPEGWVLTIDRFGNGALNRRSND